ncbi:hypothetical protein H696_01196 [Fonticula alba]|uniref:Adenosine kinase n=1 Tax=Fonticula alba TaxID=691883 RepID=A0A058ZCX2_FONAL|nr:hypothetical protein H696_01196 [Fonticula alba]KCV71778.1 hypothetical protein H696_01196 [Fonticula alba]|eukprot:XP_009493356.1 hypothetical protein H696_01196 [Fonticula alba]
MPIYEEVAKMPDMFHIAGGATQNSIRVAQWMLPDNPDSTAFFGGVGNDTQGETLRRVATSDGVLTRYQVIEDGTPTGTCAVLINGLNRSMVTNLGAANKFNIDHLKCQENLDIVHNAELRFVSGFFLTVSPDTAMLVAKDSSERKKTFMLNLSAPFIPQFFTEPLMALMPYTDILIGNESEFLALGQTLGVAASGEALTPEDVVRHVALNIPKADGSARLILCTQGADPTLVGTTENGEVKVTSHPANLIPVEEIVDTNGAGDAFAGGFISRFVLGRPVEECIAAGNYAAGVIIRHSGISIPKERPAF